MMPEAVGVTMLVVAACEQIGIPYLIGGSMASAFYGVTRSTIDSDLVADMGEELIEPFVQAMRPEFYVDAEMIRGAIRSQSCFNLIHLKTMFKVDIFVMKARSFDQNQMKRRVLQSLGANDEPRAYVTTPEDIILAKLEWYRMGGEVSDRQWRDILGVLKVQAGRLDNDYMQRWAETLNVADLLQRAMDQSEKKGR